MDTSKIEYIRNRQILYAIIIRSGYKPNDSDFFTESENEFQLGFLKRIKGAVIKPHFHVSQNIIIEKAQEFIHLLKGKVKINFFDTNGLEFDHTFLNKGDSILSITGGHGFEFSKNSVFFEVKQGPQYNNIKKFID